MTTKRVITQGELSVLMENMADQVRIEYGGPSFKPDLNRSTSLKIYGVPRGGIPVAMSLAAKLGFMVDTPEKADIIVDDIYDSGATKERYRAKFPDKPFFALVDKRDSGWADQWVVLPWEVSEEGSDASADDIVIRLLEFIGEDPHREGLQETPGRVLRAWSDWSSGYKQDPAKILKTFVDGSERCGDELVIVNNIPIVSKCEHHLADIIGIAHVGYIPNGKVVGLSKLPRVVDVFARRLQVQERLTNQIADAIDEHLDPKGVGVIIRAAHHCMSTRGVKIHGSVTTTSAVRGALLSKPEARAEFLQLCDAAERHRG